MLHRQNTLYSAQGLSKNCIIYVRVLNKKVKEATTLFMSDEYQCFKDNPLPMYELVLHANCTVAHILESPNFFQTYTRLNLNGSIGGKEASKKSIPVQMHSFDSRFRLY